MAWLVPPSGTCVVYVGQLDIVVARTRWISHHVRCWQCQTCTCLSYRLAVESVGNCGPVMRTTQPAQHTASGLECVSDKAVHVLVVCYVLQRPCASTPHC